MLILQLAKRSLTKGASLAPVILASALVFAVGSAASAADSSNGSLDNIWADQGQGGAEPVQSVPQSQEQTQQQPPQQTPQQTPQSAQQQVKQQVAPKPKVQAPAEQPAPQQAQQPSAVAGPNATTVAAPMCTLEDFQRSTLAQKGGWPGIGPFKTAEGNPLDLIDPADNRLRLQVAGEHLTAAELILSKQKASNQDFLDLEMATDFLMEAVGVKGKKIAGLNSELEKNKQSVLLKSDKSPLSLNAGHFMVYIQRQPASVAEKVSYSIRVNSRDVNKDVLKQHSTAQGNEGGAPLPGSDGKTAVATSENRGTDGAESSPGTAGDALKGRFVDVIKNWQKVKKGVVRNRQIEDLSAALHGRALQRQTDAVKWLITNHKYYDMTPLGVIVYRYSELNSGTKYSVISQVKESSKLIDEASGKVLKETSDTYKVNYTIEKVGDKWLITDSAIVPTNQPGQAAHPPSGKASR
jgi:hypothetical protein